MLQVHLPSLPSWEAVTLQCLTDETQANLASSESQLCPFQPCDLKLMNNISETLSVITFKQIPVLFTVSKLKTDTHTDHGI